MSTGAAKRKARKQREKEQHDVYAGLYDLEWHKLRHKKDPDYRKYYYGVPSHIRELMKEYPYWALYERTDNHYPVRVFSFVDRAPPAPDGSIDLSKKVTFARGAFPVELKADEKSEGYEVDIRTIALGALKRVDKWDEKQMKLLVQRMGEFKAKRFAHPGGYMYFQTENNKAPDQEKTETGEDAAAAASKPE